MKITDSDFETECDKKNREFDTVFNRNSVLILCYMKKVLFLC